MSESALLPDGFKVLVDAPYDGVAEEWCWVPVAFAPTEEAAIALAREQNVVDDAGLVLGGREWFRRDPAYKPQGDHTWRNEKEDIDLDYEPWIPCSKWAKTGIEVWRLEVTDDPVVTNSGEAA
jgi:hypothetical protein